MRHVPGDGPPIPVVTLCISRVEWLSPCERRRGAGVEGRPPGARIHRRAGPGGRRVRIDGDVLLAAAAASLDQKLADVDLQGDVLPPEQAGAVLVLADVVEGVGW
jgi:hypothetical protein